MEPTAITSTSAPAIANEALSDDDLLELLALPEGLRGQPVEAEAQLSPEEQAFAEERRTSIGGTDAAAICGFSTYRNLWDVVAEKRGLIPVFKATERMRFGNLFEDPILQEYARRTGQEVVKGPFIRDAAKPFLGAHPDGLVVGRKKGAEVKTVEWGRDQWSEPGQPIRVPKAYYVQVQHYLGVHRYDAWDLVAQFGLSKLRWYPVEPNPKVIATLRERAEMVWERYIVGNELPPIEPSDRARAWLKLRFPEPKNETLVLANEEQAEAITKWLESKKSREAWLAEEEKWKLHVQTAIGEATGIVSGAITVTWKKDRDSVAAVTDWEGLLALYAQRHGFQVQAKDIVEFTRTITTRKGARKLLPKERR
jgi:putative phage-type endonuclease